MSTLVLSNRVQMSEESAIAKVNERARALRASGKDILSLTVGEPDFDTPSFIKTAGIAAIQAGKTKYSPIDGTPELKVAVINKFKNENRLSYASHQIIISCGAKQSLYNAIQALVNPDDEVIIPAPYWVSYPDMVRLAGGKPVIVNTHLQDNFKLSPAQLEAAITPRTRALILNSPSNPTGMIYRLKELESLAAVLLRYPNIHIISDDIYEHIRWQDEPFSNIANACEELKDRTLVINGVSKAYAMTGWRIGYAAGHPDLINSMKKIQSQSTSGACTIAQAAATVALTGPQDCVVEMCQAYRKRHDYFIQALSEIKDFTCRSNDGTFYAFIDASQAIFKLSAQGIKDDIDFSEYIINSIGIAVVPGTPFGAINHLRFSYATDLETLKKALKRLKSLLA